MAKDKSFYEKLQDAKTDGDVAKIYKEEMKKAVEESGRKVEFVDLESDGSRCIANIRDAREERMKKRREEMLKNFDKGVPEDFCKYRVRTKSCTIEACSSPKFDNLVYLFVYTDGLKCGNLIAVKEYSRYVAFMKNVQLNKQALVNENTVLVFRPLRDKDVSINVRIINSEADVRSAYSFIGSDSINLTETIKTKLRNKDKYLFIVAWYGDNPVGFILIPEDEFSDYINVLEGVKELI